MKSESILFLPSPYFPSWRLLSESRPQPRPLPLTMSIASQLLVSSHPTESMRDLASSTFSRLRATHAWLIHLEKVIYKNEGKLHPVCSPHGWGHKFFLKASLWTFSVIPHILLLQNLSQEGRTERFLLAFLQVLKLGSALQLWHLGGSLSAGEAPQQMAWVYQTRCLLHRQQGHSIGCLPSLCLNILTWGNNHISLPILWRTYE